MGDDEDGGMIVVWMGKRTGEVLTEEFLTPRGLTLQRYPDQMQPEDPSEPRHYFIGITDELAKKTWPATASSSQEKD